MLPDEAVEQEPYMLSRKYRNRIAAIRKKANRGVIVGLANRDKIVKAIADAIRGTRDVVQREHIKADRIERVQHFCTHLRRHLGYQLDSPYKSTITTALADKALWFEIGQPNGTFTTNPVGWYSNALSIADVHNMASEARLMAGAAQSLPTTLVDSIERDIKALDASLAVVNGVCEEARCVNAEGDVIIKKMAALADTMTD